VGLVLDAYPLIAFVLGEPIADEVERLLQGDRGLMSAVNFAEVVDVLERRESVPRPDVEAVLIPLAGTALDVLPVSEAHAWRAAEIRARHYRRRTSELSLADCFVLAVAAQGDAVATADAPMARAARAEGIDVVGLPDRRGRRP
jgi:PIN domain nuclease of toxin-antitoxin system